MSDSISRVLQTIDDQHAGAAATTHRRLVAGAAGVLGTMGLLGRAASADAQLPQSPRNDAPNDPETVANTAATVEVLATIINTVGFERSGRSSTRSPVATSPPPHERSSSTSRR